MSRQENTAQSLRNSHDIFFAQFFIFRFVRHLICATFSRFLFFQRYFFSVKATESKTNTLDWGRSEIFQTNVEVVENPFG